MTGNSLRALGLLVVGVWNTTGDRHLSLISAGVAFYGFFAVFPGMAAVIALWGYVSDPSVIPAYLALARDFIPKAAYSVLETRLQALILTSHPGLGWASILSFGIALWSARAGVGALIEGVNAIHHQPPRNAIFGYVIGLALTIVLIAAVLVALAAVVAVPLALALVEFGQFEAWLIKAMSSTVAFILALGTLAAFFRLGPNLPRGSRPHVAPGAILAAFLWAGASLGLSLYLANFGAYNEIYGSIGAIIALLLWFYVSAYTVLIGAALNAEIARMRRQET